MAVARSVLRTNARVLADQDGADFPSDAHYNVYLDDAKRETWYDLVTAGWPVNYTSQTVTATGAGQYVLASGAALFSVRSVFRIDGASRTPLPRLDESIRGELLSSVGQNQALAYEVLVDPTLGHVIKLYPAAATGSVLVEYIAEAGPFSGDADTWNGPARSDQLIQYRAAAKGCRKEGRREDAKDLLDDYAELLEKVIASASWVDQRNPPRIRDVGRGVLRDPFAYQVMGTDYDGF